MNVETESTPIRGGLGNKLCYTIKSSRNLTLSVESAIFDASYLEMILGGKHEDVTDAEVQSGGVVIVTDNAGTKEVTLPADQNTVTSIILEDVDGNQESITVTAGVGEVPVTFKAGEGDELKYFYKKKVTGTKYTIDATVFSNKCHVTYRTLSYDVDTEAVYSDIWWEFPSVTSDGNLDLSLTAGEALNSTLTFTATVPAGASELGVKYEQLRV